ARAVCAPLQNGIRWAGEVLESGVRLVADKRELAAENQRLRRRVAELTQETQLLTELRFENQRLRDMLGFARARPDWTLKAATIIARSPASWYHGLTIDRGERDGVRPDMVVVTPQGLVGRVTGTTARTAEVLLITDRESAVGVLVQANRIQGLLEGYGDRNRLRMVNISYDADVRRGQVVVTSGVSEIFPGGIPVGKVVSVSSGARGLLKQAVIRPAVDFDRVEEVFVLVSEQAGGS
ncbi:MAG: rod shape-determining protein MreC, partial [Syntrophomonadaceae bacterium]|nr:rod shape-determining protein MreC [Syntrophomonadaceae bacterium]